MDCSKTEIFLSEWYRLCKSKEVGCEACATCKMWFLDKEQGGCKASAMKDPQRAIKIVQEWSDEHPPKTLLTEFLKLFPKTELNGMGIPDIAPCKLGLVELNSKCIENCVHQYCLGIPCKECWDTPIEESEETK